MQYTCFTNCKHVWPQLREKLHIKSWVNELFPHSVTLCLNRKTFTIASAGVPKSCVSVFGSWMSHLLVMIRNSQHISVKSLFSTVWAFSSMAPSISALCNTLLYITTHVCPLWTYHTIRGSSPAMHRLIKGLQCCSSLVPLTLGV